MISFIQGNLNHCRVAQDLLYQYMVEEKVDIALLSDPHRIEPTANWYSDCGQQRAAIYIMSDRVTIANVLKDPEFVSARINGVQVFSCYASPNQPLVVFTDFLQRLEDKIRTIPQGVPVLVTGDFNARSPAWGDWVSNARGEELGMLIESLELLIMNSGSIPTFTRGAGSVIDLTLVSESLTGRFSGWRVMDSVFNSSDHHYIRFHLSESTPNQPQPAAIDPQGWNTSGGIDAEAIHTGLLIAAWLDGGHRRDAQDAEAGARTLRSRIATACDFALPKRRIAKPGKRPVHWWNAEIANLRAECTRTKRTKVRMVARISRLRERDAGDFDEVRANAELERTNDAFTTAKKQLKHAISRSKKACWNELIASVDNDPFGKPYKLVMRKLRGPPATATMEHQTLENVISTLFPPHERRPACPTTPAEQIVEFTREEVDAVVERAKTKNKAPGPDGITSRILAAVHKANQRTLEELFNTCLKCGTFPSEWKSSRVVLLRKGDKPEGLPSSYRPLCLLNDVGKLLESLLTRRLEESIFRNGGLSPNQFGFRKGLSTDDAIRQVHQTVLEEINGGRFCLAIGIDIRNAFNSIKWKDILTALEKWNTPPYLLKMFQSYFSNRHGTTDPSPCNRGLDFEIMGGVPQGSVVGPLLWNATFDRVLKEPLSEGSKLMGFADDTLVLVSADTVRDLEHRANNALQEVEQRISSLGLEIATTKTEAVMFTYRYKYTKPNISVCGTPIALADQMTYLGVVIDKSCLFKAHIKKATQKAEKIGGNLSRLMPNIGGPREARRRLLTSVVHSVLLYGAPSWAHTLDLVPANVALLNRTQRKVLLRKTRAYRTTSEAAINVIAGIPPADLLARNLEVEYRRRRSSAMPNTAPVFPTEAAWQRRWDSAETGLWTKRLIPDVTSWTRRRFGEVNYHLTQFLSGHGCFGKYLSKIQKAENTSCVDCGATMDDPEHAFFMCDRWWQRRRELEVQINRDFTPSTAIAVMMESRHNWDAVNRYVDLILTAREKEERERQRGPLMENLT